jgi:hypothetical protein
LLNKAAGKSSYAVSSAYLIDARAYSSSSSSKPISFIDTEEVIPKVVPFFKSF